MSNRTKVAWTVGLLILVTVVATSWYNGRDRATRVVIEGNAAHITPSVENAPPVTQSAESAHTNPGEPAISDISERDAPAVATKPTGKRPVFAKARRSAVKRHEPVEEPKAEESSAAS